MVVLVHKQRLNKWRLTIGSDGFKLTLIFNEIMLGKGVGINKWSLGLKLLAKKDQNQ